MNNTWHRAIILVDMNCFFAAIEQLDNPELRGQPIAVTNGETGTCIITSSYEARRYGVKTGMRLKAAKQLCPHLIQIPSRPKRYAEISIRIMDALQQVTPDIEIFSVDEAFLDVTKCLRIYKDPIDAAKLTKNIVQEVSNLPCSVGLSGDKTTAKFAAESKKPNGFTVIPPWEAEQTLANVPVTKLCGIGPNIARFLAQYDVIYCKDMAKIPISILGKRFGNLGRRIWLMCQGKDPEAVHTTIAQPKSMGHGKVLPPGTIAIETVKINLMYMAEKVAARLRRNNMRASEFFIGICTDSWQWLSYNHKVFSATNDGKEIYAGCEELIKLYPDPGIVRQIQVTALDPLAEMRQLDLFDNADNQHKELLNTTIDCINQKFGSFTIAPASLLKRTTTPNVIAPAWRPTKSRNTV